MKKALFKEILRLTQLQREALQNDNMDDFEILLEKRQICMDKIDELKNSSAYILDDEDKQILLQTTAIEKENNEEFDRQYADVKMQLCKLRALKKRDNIYSNPYDSSNEEGFFIDKK